MAMILAAAEAGHGEVPTKEELRARLSALIGEAMARGWSLQQRGEYEALCRVLAAAERRA
ncbi:MAG: hypothetical protein EKK29_05980 [Hyphomicrobiales bacterium]|nr:MAG: hypothetical protein EKK29_05980 [Hyphomicrobiales bacterium]